MYDGLGTGNLQAGTVQILDLMIHLLYSNKKISARAHLAECSHVLHSRATLTLGAYESAIRPLSSPI
jgi:hypothetical protein